MSIFDSVLFEGQQADEYKARKEKEKQNELDKENKRNNRRYVGNNYIPGREDLKSTIASHKATDMLTREIDNRYNDYKLDDARLSYHKNHNTQYEKLKPEGRRPNGIFNGKQKEEYDSKMKEYNDAKSAHDSRTKDLESKVKDSYDRLNNVTNGHYDGINTSKYAYAKDAARRKISRDEKKKKPNNESVGIFESVELI